jgi:flagellar basal body rod protein FlgG
MDDAYTVASTMTACLKAQEVSAHNLANVNTPGFKRRLAVEQPFHAYLAAEREAVQGVQVDGVTTDFSRGAVRPTGNPLDLALGCDGFFVLDGPEGQVYTRRGDFTLDGEGRVVDSLGRTLLSEGGGALRVPGGAVSITVAEDGGVMVDGTVVGRVWVVDVPSPRSLVPAGFTAFTPMDETATPTTVARPVVRQGALEMSNANPIDELVAMVSTLRSYEAAQRTLTSIDQTSEKLTTAAQNA